MTHLTYWDYISPNQRDLIREGSYLYQEVYKDGVYSFQDYSFLVFPFAKAFEGFIKQFLLDIGLIDTVQYSSDHIRVGKLLSPDTQQFPRDQSMYSALVHAMGEDVSNMIWMTWRYCRNQVFHYFPHNKQSLSLNEARERINLILTTMSTCYNSLLSKRHSHHEKNALHDRTNSPVHLPVNT